MFVELAEDDVRVLLYLLEHSRDISRKENEHAELGKEMNPAYWLRREQITARSTKLGEKLRRALRDSRTGC